MEEWGEDLQNGPQYSEGAKNLKKKIGDHKLNPPKSSIFKRAALTAGGAIAALGIGIGAKETHDKLTEPPDFYGQPVGEGVPQVADLISITDNQNSERKPTFRNSPSMGGKELSEEELSKMGIDSNRTGDLFIQDVKGGTYPGNPENDMGMVQEGDQKYGVWSEILVPIIGGRIGEYKRTGIFVSRNFIDNNRPVNIEDKPVVLSAEPQK